jgi:hypothetical protein
MSLNIETALVKGFETGVMQVAQQMGSELRDTVRVERVSRGEEFAWDRLGSSDPAEISTRHAKTPMGNIAHTKRWASPHVFARAEGIDKADALRTINDFTNPYTEAIGMGFGREFDRQIIAAASATAKTGKTGSGTEAFPTTTHRIVHGSAGMNLIKINQAAKILRQNHIPKPWYMVVTAEQIEDVMNDSTITSADYNTVRLLMQGDVDTFGGFKWRVTELLSVDATPTRTCLAYGKRSLLLAVQKEPESRVSERDDLNYLTQVWFQSMIGATRLDEVGVVEVQCNE